MHPCSWNNKRPPSRYYWNISAFSHISCSTSPCAFDLFLPGRWWYDFFMLILYRMFFFSLAFVSLFRYLRIDHRLALLHRVIIHRWARRTWSCVPRIFGDERRYSLAARAVTFRPSRIMLNVSYIFAMVPARGCKFYSLHIFKIFYSHSI